jgi:hypothetical protein
MQTRKFIALIVGEVGTVYRYRYRMAMETNSSPLHDFLMTV